MSKGPEPAMQKRATASADDKQPVPSGRKSGKTETLDPVVQDGSSALRPRC